MSDKDDLPEGLELVNHPMEDVLDIESGSTQRPIAQYEKKDPIVTQDYDTADEDINGNFQEIFDTAMDAYEQQALDIDAIEPKYRARNQEVAVQYLNTALSAAKEKANLKMHKDKMKTKRETAGPKSVTQQGIIVADRNELLKQLMGGEKEVN